MNELTELQKLVPLLSMEPLETEITFREESAREIRYTLIVSCRNNALLRKLAEIFGCPNEHLPRRTDTRFEAADNWHGRGAVDLRELADEFMPTEGEFFDFDITIGELRSLALIT